jgi:hypothetical protein
MKLLILFVAVAVAFLLPVSLPAQNATTGSSTTATSENPTSNSAESPKPSAKLEKDKAKGNAANDAAAKPGTQESAPAPMRNVAPRPAGDAAEAGQFQIEIKHDVNSTSLQGNRARSFLNEGINQTNEVGYFFLRPVRETWKLEGVGQGRYTDNPRVDPERNSLQRMYFRLSGPSFEVNAGDALVSYSRFSLNQNIKGLTLWKEFNKRWRLSGNTGLFSDRWGSLYRPFSVFRNVYVDCRPAPLGNSTPPDTSVVPAVDGIAASGCVQTAPFSGVFVLDPNQPGKPYARLVGGGRIELKLPRSSWLAVNYSHGTDQLQSLPEAKVACTDGVSVRVTSIFPGCNLPGETEVAGSRRPASEAIRNDLLTIDTSFEVRPWRLRVNGEIAVSWTTGGDPPAGALPTNFVCASTAPVVGGAVLDARCFQGRQDDSAYRFDLVQRLGKFSWRADYSRFQPDFFSANARQIRDLEDFSARAEYEVIRQILLLGSWRRSTDNLNGKRNFTSIVRAPEARIILRELQIYPRMTIEVGYRERNLDTAGNPLPNELRKRSTRIPFASATVPIGDTQLTFDYERRHDSDAVRPALSADTSRYAFGVRGNYTWGSWDVVPMFRFEMERLNKNLPNNAALSLTDVSISPGPGQFDSTQVFGAFDTNRAFQASLMIEAPRYVRLESVYREFNSVALSSLQASAAFDPLQRFFYFNQGFKRPFWRAALTYKLWNDENKTLTAYYERGNNFFDTGDPFVTDVRSFRETVIGGTVLFRFRR